MHFTFKCKKKKIFRVSMPPDPPSSSVVPPTCQTKKTPLSLKVLIYLTFNVMLFKGTHWLWLQINWSVFLITYWTIWGGSVLCLSNHLINPFITSITTSVITSKIKKKCAACQITQHRDIILDSFGQSLKL